MSRDAPKYEVSPRRRGIGWTVAYVSLEVPVTRTIIERLLRSFPWAVPSWLGIHSVATSGKQPRSEWVASIASAEPLDSIFVEDLHLLADKEEAFSRFATIARSTDTTMLATVRYSRQAPKPRLTAAAVLPALADTSSARSRFFLRFSCGASHYGDSRLRLFAYADRGMPVRDPEL